MHLSLIRISFNCSWKSILVLLCNPVSLILIVTFLRLGSACSSSSSCCAVSLAWAKGPTALLYNTSSPRLPGWPLHLGVPPLPPWNSKDKKYCLYKMPYVAAHVKVLGDIIAKTVPYARLPLDAPTRTRIFLGSQVTCFWGDPYWHIKTPMCILQANVVPERTTYHAWRVPRWVPSSVSSRILCSDMASWAWTSGTQKIKLTARKWCWAISPDSRVSHPLCSLAVGYYSQSKIWHLLGLTLRCMPTGKGPLRNPPRKIF